jgi:hypothetical protein
MARLTPEQRQVLLTIKQRAAKKGASPMELKAAVETGLVESSLRNLPGGDGSSVGWRQETKSSYPTQNRMSVAAAADRFFDEAIALRGKYKRAGDLAQAVQRSAHPERYQQRSGEAAGLIGSPRGAYSPAGRSGSVTTTRTTPGVDNSAARRALLVQFASQGAARNPGAVAALAQALPGAQDTPAKTTTTTSRSSTPSAGGGFAKGHSPLRELFYNGPGGVNVKDGQKEPIGFVGGHTDHVHVAAGPKTVVDLGKLAQQMGLHVGENPKFGGVNPVHVPNSFHYKGEAIDVSGTPEQMRQFNHAVAKLYKLA